jgi:hypothetical protein
MLELTKVDFNFGLVPYGEYFALQNVIVCSMMDDISYDKVPNGEPAAGHFTRICE